MESKLSVKTIWIAAGLVLGVGILLGFQTHRELKTLRGRLASKIRDIHQLRTLAGEARRGQTSRRAYEQFQQKRPVDIETVLVSAGLRYKIRDIRPSPKTIPGWTVRQKEVDLSEEEVSLSRVMALVVQVENADVNHASSARRASPPWRLKKCLIRASSRSAGQAEVVLLFEALEGTQS